MNMAATGESAAELVAGADPSLLLLCDHASNHVPADIDLGVPDEVLTRHVAIDIGAAPLTYTLAERFAARAVLARVSRLVIDLHRQPDHPALIPTISDGHAVPGNLTADRTERIRRFHAPYHRVIASTIASARPELIVSVHSFTRQLETSGDRRIWDAGVLYNRDDRAARLAIASLREQEIETGDNQPYSGRLLNATLNRHAEARAIPYIAIEVCNDQIADAAGVAKWRDRLAKMIVQVRNGLALKAAGAT